MAPAAQRRLLLALVALGQCRHHRAEAAVAVRPLVAALVLSRVGGAWAQGDDPDDDLEFELPSAEEVEQDSLTALSKNSMAVIGSSVAAFLAEEDMSAEDRACIVRGSEKFTGNIMTVASHIVMLIQQVMGKREDVPGLDAMLAKPIVLPDLEVRMGDGGGAKAAGGGAAAAKGTPSADPPPAKPKAQTAAKAAAPWGQGGGAAGGGQGSAEVTGEKDLSLYWGNGGADGDASAATSRRLDGGELDFSKLDFDKLVGGTGLLMHVSAVFLELGYSLQLLAKLSQHIADDCVTGEALHALELAGQHARDIKYIGGHFIANGADVVTEMAQAAVDYREKNFSAFGRNIGTAMRKILLSDNPNATIPAGIAGRYMMVNMSMGFVKGFFGKGFTLGIRLDADPDEPLRVDLESCIANNLPFFEQIWSALAFAYVQQQARKSHHRQTEQEKSTGHMQLGTSVAVAALQFPDALTRCGIGEGQVDMLMDSAKAFGQGMHLTLSTPNKRVSKEHMMQDVGKTIQDWGRLDWYVFGYDLGVVLREMCLSMFPQKYSVDDAGDLRQRLENLAAAAAGVAPEGLRGTLPRLAVVPALLIALAGAAFASSRGERRGFRRSRRCPGPGHEADSEAGVGGCLAAASSSSSSSAPHRGGGALE